MTPDEFWSKWAPEWAYERVDRAQFFEDLEAVIARRKTVLGPKPEGEEIDQTPARDERGD